MAMNMQLVSTAIKNLPLIEKILYHIANIVGSREKFSIKIYSSDAVEAKILWGAFEYRKGQQFHLELFCTHKALMVLQRSVLKQSFKMQTRLQ